jgi:hypothetical protein
MSGTRRAVAVTCIAVIVFAAFLPLGGVSMEWLVLTPAFTLLLPFSTPVIRREARRSNERSIPLLAILDPRGPPLTSSHA